MACPEYKALLPGYAEGSLSTEQVRLLRDHLPHCESCRRTIRLLKMDDDAIRKMLFRPPREQAARRRRLYRSALFFAVVLLISLLGLYLAYLSLESRAPTGTRRPARPDPLIAVEASGTAPVAFLEDLSRRTGVPIRLTETARARLSAGEPVTMSRAAVRLGDLLETWVPSRGLRLEWRDGGYLVTDAVTIGGGPAPPRESE